MPNTGLSAVWHDEGKKWELRELPLPEVEPDAVSIRVQATSVCGSDLHLWRGDPVVIRERRLGRSHCVSMGRAAVCSIREGVSYDS